MLKTWRSRLGYLKLRLIVLWRDLFGHETVKERLLIDGLRSNDVVILRKCITRAMLLTSGLDLAEEEEEETDDFILNEEQLSWKKLVGKYGYRVKKR